MCAEGPECVELKEGPGMRFGGVQRRLAWHGRACMASRQLARSQPRNAAHMQAWGSPCCNGNGWAGAGESSTAGAVAHLPSCGSPFAMDFAIMEMVSSHTMMLPQAPATSSWRIVGSMDSGNTAPSAAHRRGWAER